MRTTLPLEAFNRHKDGYQWWCRECFKAYFRERGKLHLDQVAAARNARRELAHEHIYAHLTKAPCVDCAEPDPAVLEFDHTAEKMTEVGTLVGRASRIDLIEAEIARCDVVCCNCHRRRTYLRRGTTRTPEAAQRVADPRLRRTLEWIYDLLAQSKCVDCDVADPLVLEFDHIGLKRKNVMDMVWSGFGMETIQLEIHECEIRCANCHRRKTLADGNSFRHRARTAARSACDTPPRASGATG